MLHKYLLTTLGVFDLSALGKGANRDGIALPPLVPIRTLGGLLWLTTKLEAGRVIVNCDSVGSLKNI